jgi:hypothetical protein
MRITVTELRAFSWPYVFTTKEMPQDLRNENLIIATPGPRPDLSASKSLNFRQQQVQLHVK